MSQTCEVYIIAKESVPHVKRILATSVQEKVSNRLGERACDMLAVYIEVNGIFKQDLEFRGTTLNDPATFTFFINGVLVFLTKKDGLEIQFNHKNDPLSTHADKQQ